MTSHMKHTALLAALAAVGAIGTHAASAAAATTQNIGPRSSTPAARLRLVEPSPRIFVHADPRVVFRVRVPQLRLRMR
jgi:hypothetical protein